jgi:hypothetical protein
MTWMLRRLLSGILLALVAAGGGRLSTVDVLVFHEGSVEADGFRSHFEASSGCHQDGCSMRSTAHESRPGPSLAAPAIQAAPPESVGCVAPVPDVPPLFTSSSYLSRAPPVPA